MNTIAIIGGGASGMMAAIFAARKGAKVLLLEQNDRLGKKILVTGNGRCNNTNTYQDASCYRSEQPDFITRVLDQFPVEKVIAFFRELGIYPKDRNGYLYPFSDQASAVRDVLEQEVYRLGVDVRTGISCTGIQKINERFSLQTSHGSLTVDQVILCNGSKAAPSTGSDGSGYALAKQPQISDSDSVRSAIGQGTNNYTVSQINRYVTAVANRGTVYSLSLIDKTTDSNGKLIKDYTPEVVNQMDEISSSTWDLVHNGMESMVKSSSTFAGMDISMGGKTGTAQYSKIHADNVLFVGYAPADSPEISIAVRIANGYASTYAAEIGRDITKVYFNPESADELLQGYASSLGTAGAGD